MNDQPEQLAYPAEMPPGLFGFAPEPENAAEAQETALAVDIVESEGGEIG